MQQIGKRIKNIRLAKNLKQQTIANAIGMSLTAYSNIECGKTEQITLQRVMQIAAALETDITTLLNGHDQSTDSSVTALQNELMQTKDKLNKANKQIEDLRGGGKYEAINNNLQLPFLMSSQ